MQSLLAMVAGFGLLVTFIGHVALVCGYDLYGKGWNVLFVGIFSRMIPFQALMSQVPVQTQRGSFNAINASISQLAGGLASLVAGHIVQEGVDGKLHHYDVAGYVVVATSLLASVLLWRIQRAVSSQPQPG